MQRLVVLVLLLAGCTTFRHAARLSPNDTKAEALEVMGAPEDTEFNGDVEVWQYFGIVSVGTCDYRQLWFRQGRLERTTAYRSICSFGCASCLRPIDWSAPPDATLEIRER